MTNNQQDAVQDCKYALSLSETALHTHFSIWNNTADDLDENDALYALTLKEIAHKLGTTECLLAEEV